MIAQGLAKSGQVCGLGRCSRSRLVCAIVAVVVIVLCAVCCVYGASLQPAKELLGTYLCRKVRSRDVDSLRDRHINQLLQVDDYGRTVGVAYSNSVFVVSASLQR